MQNHVFAVQGCNKFGVRTLRKRCKEAEFHLRTQPVSSTQRALRLRNNIDETGLSSTALHHMEGASRRKLRQWCCGFKKPASRIHSENFATSGVAMVGRLILFPEWAESGEHWILKVQQCSTHQRSSVDRQNLQLFLPLFRGMAFLWTSELTFVMAAYQCHAFWATSSSGARLDRKDVSFLEMRWKHHQTPSLHIPIIFPECVARVPVSLWGSGGWGCVRSTLRLRLQPSATVRNRSQPSATVRNRPREGCMAVPMVSSAKGVTFGGCAYRVASFRVAGVALRDIQTRVESRVVWQAQYFCDVFRRWVPVFVAGATLWTWSSSFCVAGAAL